MKTAIRGLFVVVVVAVVAPLLEVVVVVNGFSSPALTTTTTTTRSNKAFVSMATTDGSSSSSSSTATDRRSFVVKSLVTTTAFALANVAVPRAAFAKDYVAKFDDIKQIYILGTSLDKLATKASNPDQVEGALEGLRAFNRDPKFYPGYARNFISKSVKNNADGDVRLGYIKKACKIISSIEPLLDGEQGLQGKEASAEAVKRVKESQVLVAKFLTEVSIDDERIQTFAAAHK